MRSQLIIFVTTARVKYGQDAIAGFRLDFAIFMKRGISPIAAMRADGRLLPLRRCASTPLRRYRLRPFAGRAMRLMTP